MSGTKVFVGNLAWSVDSQDLQEHMSTSGGVVTAEILTLRDGRSKGSGTVTFDCEQSATQAIQDMTDTELKGRPIWLREFREEQKSAGNGGGNGGAPQYQQQAAPEVVEGAADCQVHVGNLTWGTTSEQLRYLVEEYGQAGITHCEVVIGRDGRSRGYGLVVFNSPDDAAQCIEGLHGTMLEDRDLTVRISRPRGERTPQGPRQGGGTGGMQRGAVGNDETGYTVFVGNMPWSFSWQQLKDMAKDYGDVKFVDVGKDRQGRSRGVGTIAFHELSSAHDCIQKLNGFEVEGRALLVKEDYKNPLPTSADATQDAL